MCPLNFNSGHWYQISFCYGFNILPSLTVQKVGVSSDSNHIYRYLQTQCPGNRYHLQTHDNILFSMNTEDPQTNIVLNGTDIFLHPSQTQYMCSISKI